MRSQGMRAGQVSRWVLLANGGKEMLIEGVLVNWGFDLSNDSIQIRIELKNASTYNNINEEMRELNEKIVKLAIDEA